MLRLDTVAGFDSDHADLLRLRNFHAREAQFAWSAGIWGEVSFDFELDASRRPIFLEVELDVLREPNVLEGHDVAVFLNGLRIGATHIVRRELVTFPVRPDAVVPHGNVLVLDTPAAARPADFGHPDERLLGVKLFSLALYGR